MIGLANRLNKAIKVAACIDRGVSEPTPVEAEAKRMVDSVKHYAVYAITGDKETPIAWRLYAPDVPRIIAAAQRRMLRAYESIVEGDPLYVCTRFEAREEACI